MKSKNNIHVQYTDISYKFTTSYDMSMYKHVILHFIEVTQLGLMNVEYKKPALV